MSFRFSLARRTLEGGGNLVAEGVGATAIFPWERGRLARTAVKCTTDRAGRTPALQQTAPTCRTPSPQQYTASNSRPSAVAPDNRHMFPRSGTKTHPMLPSAATRHDGWPLAIIALLGTAHLLVRTSTFGVAINADAVTYMSTAESLVAGEGLRTFSDGKYVNWPPAFPLLLAAFRVAGFELAEAGRLLNAAILGATALVVGLWLLRCLRHRALALLGAVSMATSLPLCHVSSYLISEPAFILFILLALVPLDSFLKGRGGRTAFAVAIVFASLAATTRYLGATVIVAGVSMLLFRRTVPLSAKLKDATIYGALSSLPLAISMLRNQAVSGTPTGARFEKDASGYSVFDSFIQLADTTYIGLLPATAPNWVGYLLLGGVTLVGLGIVLVWVDAARGRAPTSIHSKEASAIYPCAVFSAIYLFVLVATAGNTTEEIIGARYVAPVYAPLAIVAIALLDRFLALQAQGPLKAIKLTVASLALAAAFANIGIASLKNWQLTEKSLATGYYGYSTRPWAQSATVAHLKSNGIAAPVYSNDPAAVYYLATAPMRVRSVPNVLAREKCAAWLRRIREAGGAHVVWFHTRHTWPHGEIVTQDKEKLIRSRPNNRRFCNIDTLPPTVVTRLAELPDGTIYRIAAT